MNKEKTIYSDYLIALVESFMEKGDGKSLKKTKAEMQQWFCDVAKAVGQWGTRSFNRLTIFNQLAAIGAAIEDNNFVTFTSKRGCEGGCILKIHDPKKLIDNLRGLSDEEVIEYVKDFKEGRTDKKANNNKKHKEKHSRSESDFEALRKQLEPEKKTSEEDKPEPPKSSPVGVVLPPGIEPVVTGSVGTRPRQKKKDSPISISTRRSYSPKLLREARYIGILEKYGPKIKMKMDLREIVGILTNNYLLEFTDVFSNSQELKTRICSGKLSTVFSLASDSTIRYKATGQGIVSFTELNMKYQMSNDIQEASLLVYDPHHEWRNSVNSSYVDTFDIKSFSQASEVCAVRAHWGCTPVALYNAFSEFHRPIVGRYQYITMPEVPLPFIKNDIIPSLPDLSGIVTGESSKELEKFRNTIILYLADLNATA